MPGVYISYPFCAQKCTYCNFASGVFPRDLERKYMPALQREIAKHCWEWRPETVYLGGGTPSQIEPDELTQILALIPRRPWTEATLEAAPGTITREKAIAWSNAGINRVSLGVQSFHLAELKRTGRKHTGETVASDLEALRSAAITNINIDLIAGLPGQSHASWRESLDAIERLDPPHVSVYMLEVDEDSRLGNEVLLNGKRYGAPEVPADELTVELYETAVAELARMGIPRYEISNFAKPGWESRHNLKYWKLEPYIGFGADAHSFDGTTRSQNTDDVQQYADLDDPCTERTLADLAGDKLLVGLRLTKGVSITREERTRLAQPIDRFVGAGLLAEDESMLRFTEAGVLLSNEVLAELVYA